MIDSMERSCLPAFFFLHLIFLFLFIPATAAVFSIAKPGCSDKCGDVSIPYPFGINSKDCYREGFELTCNDTHFDPPKLFLSAVVPAAIEVTNISFYSTVTILYTNITKQCNGDGGYTDVVLGTESPLTFSYTKNKITAIGCDTFMFVTSSGDKMTGCMSTCSDLSIEGNDTICSGIGCCQARIPVGAKRLLIWVGSTYNHTTTSDIGNCSYAFAVEEDWYKFKISDIKDFNLRSVPVKLDWAIGNQNCEEAMNSATMAYDFVCGANSKCSNSTNGPGYRCTCIDGFEGNPYLPNGCQAACQGIWLKRLLSELLGIQEEAFSIRVDNKSAIALSKNPVHHGRSKHIETRYHFIRKCIEEKLIDVCYVRTHDQLADVCTKSLGVQRFQELRNQLGMKDLNFQD